MRSVVFFICFILISFLVKGQHPTNLSVSNITSNSVTLSWDSSPCNGNVNLKFRSVPGSWLPNITNVTSPYTLTGLNPSTDYRWTVKCVGNSGWQTNNNFTTSSPSQTPTINSIDITDSIDCFGGLASVKVNVNQTIPLSSYKLIIGYMTGNSFVSFASANQGYFNYVNINNSLHARSWTVRLVDSIPYFSANQLGSGTSMNGVIDEVSSFVITHPQQLVATNNQISSSMNICFGDCIAQEQFLISGGTPPYNCQWSGTPSSFNISSIDTLSNLCAGSYNVIISDANNCQTGSYANFNIFSEQYSNFSVSNNDFIITEPPLITSTDVQTASGSFTWIDGNTYTSSNNTATYTYTLPNGCDSVVTLNLTVIPTISNITINDSIDCYGGFANVTVNLNQTIPSTLCKLVLGYYIGNIFIPFSSVNQANLNYVNLTNVLAGNYVVRLVDSVSYYTANSMGSGISNVGVYDEVINFVITQPDLLQASSSSLNNYNNYDISCNGFNDGAISVTISGGTGPFTYLWSNGLTASSISALSAGGYLCTVTDANGCSTSTNILLTEPTSISLGTTVTPPTCFGGSDGSIILQASGGISPYSNFQWSHGPLSSQVTNLSAGSYQVSFEDDNGCLFNSGNISVSEPSYITAFDSQTHCESYVWIDGINYTSSNNTATYLLQSTNGCDSLVTLDLTINNSNTGIDAQVHCDSYTWIDGVNYTSSNNSATYVLQNSFGCDSVVTLDLTINPSANIVTNINTCNSYTWPVNGITYTSSGIYDTTFVFNTSALIDTFSSLTYCASYPSQALSSTASSIISEVILNGENFNINNNTAGLNDWYEDYSGQMFADLLPGQSYTVFVSLDDLSSFSSYPSEGKVFIDFNIDGDFLDQGEEIGVIPFGNTTSASISFTVPSNVPLGATRMRVVSQYQSSSNIASIGPCDISTNFSAPWFGATEDYSLSFINVSATNINSTGCDSTISLNLTINQPDTSYTNITACDSLLWNDSVYYQSGTYYVNSTQSNNYSMYFDGVNDFLEGGAANELDVSTPNGLYNWSNLITISAWIKPYALTGSTQRIISHSSGGTGQQYALTIDANGKILFLAGSGAFEQGIGNISNSSVSINQWNHVAMTYDGIAVKLYLNGNLDFVHNVVDNFPSVNASIYLGQRADGAEKFYGLMDDVSVWNIALSQSEIQSYMYCFPQTTISSLVGHWNFESITSNLVDDMSGNNGNQLMELHIIHNVPLQSCNLTTVNGCDSTAVLNLTINNNSSSSVTSCNSYTWNGLTYNSSGFISNTFTDIYGCDSVHTLLTINQSDTSYTNVTACDSLVWNGMTYTQSGTYYSINGGQILSGYDYLGTIGNQHYYLSQTYSTWTVANQQCNY